MEKQGQPEASKNYMSEDLTDDLDMELSTFYSEIMLRNLPARKVESDPVSDQMIDSAANQAIGKLFYAIDDRYRELIRSRKITTREEAAAFLKDATANIARRISEWSEDFPIKS